MSVYPCPLGLQFAKTVTLGCGQQQFLWFASIRGIEDATFTAHGFSLSLDPETLSCGTLSSQCR